MAIEKAKEFFRERGMEDRVLEFDASSATVELAAAAVGCEPARIAKTLSFHVDGQVALVVAAGDARIDNQKFKAEFQTKAKMLKTEEVEPLVGHGVGGVCPFAVNEGCNVYLDDSLRRFDVVYPACGSASSAIGLTLSEAGGVHAAERLGGRLQTPLTQTRGSRTGTTPATVAAWLFRKTSGV